MPKSPSSHFSFVLSAIERPRCVCCQTRMVLARTMPGPSGYDFRTFECEKCDHVDTKLVARDPMKSGAQKWIAGGLRPPN